MQHVDLAESPIPVHSHPKDRGDESGKSSSSILPGREAALWAARSCAVGVQASRRKLPPLLQVRVREEPLGTPGFVVFDDRSVFKESAEAVARPALAVRPRNSALVRGVHPA